jgi:Fe-Mn family superoxide dismutase
MSFALPRLPYPKDGLEPHMSAKTLEFHHDKHHRTYVTTLGTLIAGSPLADQSLEQIIRATAKDESKTAIFNNAAQAWNHGFFWNP